MMPYKRKKTDFFLEVPEKLQEEVRKRLHRMDQVRTGSIWSPSFEDGMRFVYLQLLSASDNNTSKRCHEIIEGYSRLRNLDFKRSRIIYEFRKKYEEEAMERARNERE
ncbi:MAG: hypothetical protein OEY18_14645 [Candidatus Aminicenantes bacterium]|nr:hypothetical protein [Candidatus Aminicenantes bacterium]MDH5743157.1 hypothetical protein [Candidatus Aminicenantes bacterium]